MTLLRRTLPLLAALWFAAASAQVEPQVTERMAPAAEGDRAVERALREVFGDTYNMETRPQESGWARYVYNRVDLNGDGEDEVLALLIDPDVCGAGGCTLVVLVPDGSSYAVQSDIGPVQGPAYAAESATEGWRDLIVGVGGGGMEGGYAVLRYDPETGAYPANPTGEPAEPLAEAAPAVEVVSIPEDPEGGLRLSPGTPM